MRISTRRFLHIAIFVYLCYVNPTEPLRADELPKPPTGEVRLGSGRVVDYTIHFDRNSLQDSVRVGESLIALTSAGCLLRFELPTVRLVREQIGTEQVICLGRGEGGAVLAGLSDGRVCRVDPATLDLADVAKLAAPPQWIGWSKANGNRPAGLVVITEATKPVDRDGRHWNVPNSVVNDLSTGKTFALESLATTFLLDRAGRVWLGADRGEWGGNVWRVDLIKGRADAIQPPPSHKPDRKAFWQGVTGFIELRDGQVWAFGGTSHMGFNSGYLTRLDEKEPRSLLTFEGPHGPEEKVDPDRPMLPVTRVVEENNSLLVFSYSDVFRFDKKLKSGKRVASLEIQYRWGRPDAVGAYPSLRTVHPPTREGEPYALATIADGYVLLDGAKVIPHRLAGQLGASQVHRVLNTSEGNLILESNDQLPTWQLGAKGWEIASFAPPLEPAPDNDAAELEKNDEDWYKTHILVGPGGAIYTVSSTSTSPGTRTTARRARGKSEQIGREESSLVPSYSFITADGTLWNIDFGALLRFEKGQWETVAHVSEKSSPYYLAPLDTNGPPWLLLDQRSERLWRLDHGAKGENPRLTSVKIQEGGKTLRIVGAIRWTNDALLLSTDSGLRIFTPATQVLSRADLPEPAQPATSLARDGLERLWQGNATGLWLCAPKAKTLESFDRVPWIAQGGIEALVADPQHTDGVILALGPRGVAFLRARQKP